MKCESCQINNVEVQKKIEESQYFYKLCNDCYERLINKALRPKEYFNLVANHGRTFHLQSDFYDDKTGNACQPTMKIKDKEIFPFPEVKSIKHNLEMLIDYACVSFFIPDEIVKELKQFDKKEVLNYLDVKINHDRGINYKVYEIAAKILGAYAANWVRKEWNNRKDNELLIFAEALAMCLPFEEGFKIVTSELEKLDQKDLSQNISSLLYFQSNETLSWVEKIKDNIVNVSHSWGVLVAASGFDWETAKRWLYSGRPLSLIALDALIYCTSDIHKQHNILWFIENPPNPLKSGQAKIIAETLQSYLKEDEKPRVKKAIKTIINNIFETNL